MKKQILCIALSGLFVLGAAVSTQVHAQEPGGAPETAAPPPDQGGGPGRRGMMDPDQQLARMTKRYKLSADQQGQIKPILDNQQQQMQALRQDSSLSPEDRRAKMMSIRSDSRSKIEALLNDDQKKKFDEDQQRMQERMQERMQGGAGGGDAGGGNGGAPPPPQL